MYPESLRVLCGSSSGVQPCLLYDPCPGTSLLQPLLLVSIYRQFLSLIQRWKRHKEDYREKWTIDRAVLPTDDAAESTGFRWIWALSHLAFHREASHGSGMMKKDSWTIVYENVTKFNRACPLFVDSAQRRWAEARTVKLARQDL